MLRWALQKGAAVVPKTSSAARMQLPSTQPGPPALALFLSLTLDPEPNPHNPNPYLLYPEQARMAENAAIFHFELSAAEVAAIDALAANAPDGSGRLCWVNDPLRMLESLSERLGVLKA